MVSTLDAALALIRERCACNCPPVFVIDPDTPETIRAAATAAAVRLVEAGGEWTCHRLAAAAVRDAESPHEVRLYNEIGRHVGDAVRRCGVRAADDTDLQHECWLRLHRTLPVCFDSTFNCAGPAAAFTVYVRGAVYRIVKRFSAWEKRLPVNLTEALSQVACDQTFLSDVAAIDATDHLAFLLMRQGLDGTDRVVVTAKVCGEPTRDIAARLGVTPAAVRHRLLRIRAYLGGLSPV
jgi:DNA-directed RNA polymerase specialized sigma24 family protein